jgi:hypothetical protein
MRRHISNRAVRWFAGMLTGLILSASVAKAAEDFVVVNDQVEIPERGKVTGYSILAEGHRFSFLPPLQWRMESNRGEKSVTFTRRTLETAIRLRLLSSGEGDKPVETGTGPEGERWRQLVKARYPGAEIVREFVCQTGSGPGVAFDLNHGIGQHLRLESRVAFVTYGKGIVEIGQTGLAGKVEPAYEEFGTLLTSLRIQAQTPGK